MAVPYRGGHFSCIWQDFINLFMYLGSGFCIFGKVCYNDYNLRMQSCKKQPNSGQINMTTRKAGTTKSTSTTRKTSSSKPTRAKTTRAAEAEPATETAAEQAPAPQVVSIDAARATEKVAADEAIDQAVAATLTGSSEPEELKRKELIDLVVARSGMKKRDVKPVVDSMLEVLGQTLGEGREFNLPPLGKLKVQRMKDNDGTQVMVAKIRLQDSQKSDDAA